MAKKHLLVCLFVPTVCCLLVAGGCGGKSRGDLKGKVTLGSKALKYGSVQVVGGDGQLKAGMINPDGSYLVEGIGTGSVKIGVTSIDPATAVTHMRKKGEPEPKPDNTGWFPIPEKFSNVEKSGLVFELKTGVNTKDLDLTK